MNIFINFDKLCVGVANPFKCVNFKVNCNDFHDILVKKASISMVFKVIYSKIINNCGENMMVLDGFGVAFHTIFITFLYFRNKFHHFRNKYNN